MTTLPAQAIEGYACSCGFTTDDRKKFVAHVGGMKRKEGKDKHDSLGRINLLTGEVTMPPYRQRTLEQIYETKFGKKRPQPASDILTADPPPIPENTSEKKTKPGYGDTPGKTLPPSKTTGASGTELISQATQIRFIPRVFTTNLTPIMLLGYEVAIRKWGWRSDMSFENYLDTVIFHFTLEHGVQLQGAVTIFDEDEEPDDDGHKEPEPKEA